MAAPLQADVDRATRRRTAADPAPAAPPPDYESPDPASRLRALQSSHGNYFVQKTIERYNAKHPLPDKPPAPGKPPPTPVIAPSAAAQPPTAATPATHSQPPPARKSAAPAPAKPIPSVSARPKQPSAPGKAAPLSGSSAVSAAIAAPPVRTHPPKAAPAPAAGGGKAGGPTLDQWKSKVSATAGKQLVEPAPKAAPDAARALDAEAQKKSAAKPDFDAEAKKTIPPPPKVDVPIPPADTLAKSVHDRIAAVSDKRLSDQTLPELQISPGHAGIAKPQGQYPVVGPSPVAKQDQPPPKDAGATTPAAAPDPAAAQAEAKKKETGQNLTIADLARQTREKLFGPLPPSVTIHDSGPPPTPALAEPTKSDIGEAVATVLSKSQDAADEMVGLAEKTAYPHAALAAQAPEIAEKAKPPEKVRLDGELHGIGAAAGIAAEDLDAKAVSKAAQAKTQGAAAGDDLQAKAAAATAEARKKAAEDQKAIAAAKARNDDEIELKTEAAGKPSDPKLVNERQQRLLDSIDEQAATSRAAYRRALEFRDKALDKAAGDQIQAYAKTAQSEADEIKALYPDNAEKAKAEAQPSTSWGEREAKAVRDAVAVLKRDAEKESKSFQDAVTGRQVGAALEIHDWADSRLSQTRSFWEKLVALFTSWQYMAKANTEAWEKARNQETLNSMVGDFSTIASIRDVAIRHNADEIGAAIDALDEEHQVLLLQFFKSGGDSILVVAQALLGRIEQRRVPELAGQFREKSLEIDDWQKLNKLAQSLNPNFDAWHEAGEVRASVKGWGTNEKQLFAAIQHRTPLQVKAMQLAYAERYRDDDKPRDMAADIDDDLSGDEADRAKAALKGDIAGQDVFALHDALTGFWGADKAVIMETLRNKTPIERDELLARYKDEYHIDLRADMRFVLDGKERDRADALLAGDTDKADAIGLQSALHSHIFGGAEITEIDAVYAQIRREVEADAATRNMSTAEVEAEYKRRTAAVGLQWQGKYGKDQPDGLTAEFKDRLSGGEKDLAVALAVDDHIAEDAARIRMESESLYTSDKKVLSLLRKQRERAEAEVGRDMGESLKEQAKKEKWTPEQTKKKFEELVDAKAQKNLDNLEKYYDKAYTRGFGPGELTSVVELEMSGNEQEEARLLRKQAGKMTGAQEVYWATKGLGTDEDLLRHALKDKTKAELDAMRAEYRKNFDADMDEDVFDDVSGRDEHDFGQMLKGKPETPEEELQRMHEDREYELGSGSGLGSLFSSEESDSLKRTADKTDQAYKTYQEAVKQHGKDSKEAQAALENFHEWRGYTGETVTELRAAVDTLTDHVAMGAALIVGTIVAIATAGTATPAVVAAISALAATSASISVKLAMKGHAYGIEEYGSDVLMGAVDVAAAALTAGVGSALLRSNLFSKIAEDQLVTRVAKYGVAHAAAGLVTALPTNLVAQIISSDTWASEAPLKTALLGLLKSEAMAGAMAAGFGSIEAIKGGHATGTHEEGHGGTKPPRELPVREQKPPAPDLEVNAKQAVKAQPPAELENELKSVARPAEPPVQNRMQGGNVPPPPENAPAAHAPGHPGGTRYVEPGSPEYHSMLHEAWMENQRLTGLGPIEPAQVPPGPELPPGTEFTGIKSPDQAYAIYSDALARAPGREVGQYRNPVTGEYVVKVGRESSVNYPGGEVQHEGVGHFHPNPENILTYRSPSINDVFQAWKESWRAGRPVTEFVEHPIPGTNKRSRTFYTVDGERNTIRIEYAGPDGARVTRNFPSLSEFATDWSRRKIAPTGRSLLETIQQGNEWLKRTRREGTHGYGMGGRKPSLTMAGGSVPPSAVPLDPVLESHIKTVVGEQDLKPFADAYNQVKVEGTPLRQIVNQIPDPAFREVYEIAYDALNNPKLWEDVIGDIARGAEKVTGPPSHPEITNKYTQAVWNMSEEAARARGSKVIVHDEKSPTFLIGGEVPLTERFFDADIKYFVDDDSLVHGASSHMIQDLVIDRGLAAAGKKIDAEDLRRMMKKMPSVGAIWSSLYDAKNGLNRPEHVKAMLDKIFGHID